MYPSISAADYFLDYIKAEPVERRITRSMRGLALDDEHQGLNTLVAAASFVESDGGLGMFLNGAAIQTAQVPLNGDQGSVGVVAIGGSAEEKDAAEGLLALSRFGSESTVIKQEGVDTPSNDTWRRRFPGRYPHPNKFVRAVVHPNPGFEKINQEIEMSTLRFSAESTKFEAPKACKQ